MIRFYIGTSGWHYDDWRGIFYPAGLPRAKWLGFYAETFNTLEVNNSFYRLPSENAFKNWRESTPKDFIFSVKISRFITHIKRLQDCDEAVQKFLDKAVILKEKLGPLLYQLPPGLKRNDALLSRFLEKLPGDFKHVFEFRHRSWLEPDVFNILKKYRAGYCVFDMPGFTSPLTVTSNFAYIRFHGREGLYSGDYTDIELSEWAEKIAGPAGGMESVFIYFNNDIGGHAVRNALTIREILMKKEKSG